MGANIDGYNWTPMMMMMARDPAVVWPFFCMRLMRLRVSKRIADARLQEVSVISLLCTEIVIPLRSAICALTIYNSISEIMPASKVKTRKERSHGGFECYW